MFKCYQQRFQQETYGVRAVKFLLNGTVTDVVVFFETSFGFTSAYWSVSRVELHFLRYTKKKHSTKCVFKGILYEKIWSRNKTKLFLYIKLKQAINRMESLSNSNN